MLSRIMAVAALLISALSHAQILDRNVSASAGTSVSKSGYSLDWTAGETAIASLSAGTRLVTQGFHQPLSHREDTSGNAESCQVKVFPNPFYHLTFVTYSVPKENYRLMVYDMIGHLVSTILLEDKEGTEMVALPGIPDGAFILQLLSSEGEVKTTQIIIKTTR